MKHRCRTIYFVHGSFIIKGLRDRVGGDTNHTDYLRLTDVTHIYRVGGITRGTHVL